MTKIHRIKNNSVSFIVPILLIFLFSQCSISGSRYHLGDHQTIEGISIGMDLEKAIKKAGKKHPVEKQKTAYVEGPNQWIYQVKNKSGEVLYSFNGGFNESNRNKVFRIVIYSPQYKTHGGIKTNMKLAEIKKLTRLKSANFNYTDGLYISSSEFDGGFWMNLEEYDTARMDLNPPSLSDLPGNIKVKAIIFF